MVSMKIVVAGGTGFIGTPLVHRLLESGHDVAVLTRHATGSGPGRLIAWDGRNQGAWSEEVATAGAVVNLAGASIADGRWTDARKRILVESRLHATAALVEAMRGESSRERAFVSASAIGYYGLRQDEQLDESSPRGEGFLAELSEAWERAAHAADDFARVAIVRFGVVLAPEGGALGKMILPFKLGVGGPVGSGRQWMSWIDRDDAVRLVEWLITRPEARGVFNATAPEPVRSREFARSLGRALSRPAILPAPAIALKLAFGRMAEEVLLGGQRVLPQRALADGFRFEAPTLAECLTRQV
jgi:uncharacterized protein (TIGR01777 family)